MPETSPTAFQQWRRFNNLLGLQNHTAHRIGLERRLPERHKHSAKYDKPPPKWTGAVGDDQIGLGYYLGYEKKYNDIEAYKLAKVDP